MGKEDETDAGKREILLSAEIFFSAAFMLHKMDLACFRLCASTVGDEPNHKQQRYPTMFGFLGLKLN